MPNEKGVTKLKDFYKILMKLRYPVSIALMTVMSYQGVRFMNAGHSYEQAVPFRIFCICFALLVLTNLPRKSYMTWWSVIWVPVCYVVMHFGYEKHWIPDVCEYKFVDVIRLGKGVALTWGWMLIAVLVYIIKDGLVFDLIDRLKEAELTRHVLVAGWMIYAVVLTVFNPGYYYVIVFTLGFSCFFIACRVKKTRQRVFDAYLNAIPLCFIFVSLLSLRYRPFDTERYLLYFANENMAGMFLGVTAMVMAARLNRSWHMEKGPKRTFFLIAEHILTAWLGVLIFFNYTRTYLLGMGVSVIAYYILRMLKSKKKLRLTGRFALPLLIILISLYPGYQIIRYVPAYSDAPVFFAGEYENESKVHKGDPVDSPHYTSLARYLTRSLGKWGIDLHIEEADKTDTEEVVTINTERDVTNGRTWVWKLFLSHMSFFGHYPGHITVDGDHVIYHAHNTFFQNMYQYGVPVGILYGMLLLWAWLCAARLVLRKQNLNEASFACLSIGMIGVGMMTEWSGHPVYPSGMLIMMSLAVLLFGVSTTPKTTIRKVNLWPG